MARAPFQVLVILYRKHDEIIQYCIFERKEPYNQIQFVAGGGEGEETLIEAATRELWEETGVEVASLLPLKSLCYIPTNIFSMEQREIWGEEVYVIPEYSFGACVGELDTIRLSSEHMGFRWVTYEEAQKSLKWDSNRTALYELDCILRR